MDSAIFHTGRYQAIETAVVGLLNAQADFLSATTAGSPRAVGDAVARILAAELPTVLGDLATSYEANFARRAMADLAFTDAHNLRYVVDVKTHRSGTQFNMPNLTSVERLARLYEDEHNYFVVLLVRYTLAETQVTATQAHFIPIEFLSWDCLTIGALGWGQIQIANANRLTIDPATSRKAWMLQLCGRLLRFYPQEIAKIGRRIAYFEQVAHRWQQAADGP